MRAPLISIFRFVFLTACLGLLVGCAPGIPLLKQLKSENAQRIVVVVEDDPFEYTVPAFAEDPYVGGGVEKALFGVFGALSVQARLDQARLALNAEAKARGISTNHRKAFAEALGQRLKERGVAVDLVPATYGRGWLSVDRFFYQPRLADVQKLPKEIPSLYLTLDFGSCTVGPVTPCIRYSLNSTGVVSSPGPTQKYRGYSFVEPNLHDLSLAPSVQRFKSLEEATAKIAEFDAALASLTPGAVDNLVRGLERERTR